MREKRQKNVKTANGENYRLNSGEKYTSHEFEEWNMQHMQNEMERERDRHTSILYTDTQIIGTWGGRGA